MTTTILPVALDACGGDGSPDVCIEAARIALAAGVPILLIGPEAIVAPTGIPFRAAEDVIPMGVAEPAKAIRRMRDCAHRVGPRLVKTGEASAYVSAGDTGATFAGAYFGLGKLPTIKRGCVPATFPNIGGTPTILVDAGSSTDSSVENLVENSVLGILYARLRYGIDCPRVAQLTIGTEPDKGDALTKAAKPHIRAMAQTMGANYIGYVESKHLLNCNAADVVVANGHEGNIALKALEGGAGAVLSELFRIIYANDANQAAGRVLKADLAASLELFDPNTQGGMLALGFEGITMISHGSANAQGIANACISAAELARAGIIQNFSAALSAVKGENRIPESV